jgi:hypothetical protein
MRTHGGEPRPIPFPITIGFSAFMCVLVPVYWANYGPTNFLYFCDVALFLTLLSLWSRNSLAASMAAVGIVVPQVFWCIDFGFELSGVHLTHMTSYMFDETKPLFLRLLSLFHGWLPFLLLFLVWKLGYDRRALVAWTALACVLCLIAFFLLPPAGATLPDPNLPRNVNYVFGTNDAQPQDFLNPYFYLLAWIIALFLVFYLPTHLALMKFFSRHRL